MNGVLMGFIEGRAVWYMPNNNFMWCQSLNILITDIHNFEDACNKCKIFKDFEYAENAESKYAKFKNKKQ